MDLDSGSEGMWDTHIHCFDPDLYPFKSARAYTPPPAPIETWMMECKAKRLVLVQASIEDGSAGLIAHLGQIRNNYPRLAARGIICKDESWDTFNNDDYDNLHELGIRYCRIHGFLGEQKMDDTSLQEQIRHFAKSYPATQLGWGLSAQLPLGTWASIKEFILHDPEVSNLSIIADHVACATPSDAGTSNLDDFVQMLQAGRISVKISALYRRCNGNILQMQPIIQHFADIAPSALIWGSDWPHVVSSRGHRDPEVDKADPQNELVLLRSWLSKDQYRKMLVENPDRLFGV